MAEKDERKKLPSLAENSKLAINSKKRINTLGLCERVVAQCLIVQKKVIKKVPPQEKTPQTKGRKRKEIPKTTDHYWDTGFPTLEEQIRRGNLEIATSPWKSHAGSPYRNKKICQEGRNAKRALFISQALPFTPPKTPKKRVKQSESNEEDVWYSKCF